MDSLAAEVWAHGLELASLNLQSLDSSNPY